jgi:hypothetical protein
MIKNNEMNNVVSSLIKNKSKAIINKDITLTYGEYSITEQWDMGLGYTCHNTLTDDGDEIYAVFTPEDKLFFAIYDNTEDLYLMNKEEYAVFFIKFIRGGRV